MGGWGSGRNEYATTATVEECRSMDVNELKEATEYTGSEGAMWWGDREDPDAWLSWEAVGSQEIDDETRVSALRLRYTLTDPRTEESESVEYTVPLDYTECNFGGVRPWFRCPKCNERRGKLYLPPRGGDGRYLCRECYDLGYRSSRTSGDDLKQAELRYRRAFAKVDAENRRPHPNNMPLTPDRPKGMHQETFESLKWEVTRAEWEWSEEMRKETNRLLASLDYADSDPIPRPSPPGEE